MHDLTSVRFPELCSPTSLRYPDLIRRAVDRGASVHTVSQAVADEVMSYFRLDDDRVHVIHNGLTPLAAGPPPPAGSGPPYILALGTVEPRKGLPDLVAAFDQIAGALPDVQLKIAGPAGWGEDELTAARRVARHADRIQRVGWTDDRRTLIAGALLLAYPSLYEGFGLPPLEAMSLGVPVVATTAGAIPEVVGDAALLVAPRDPSSLADALATVATDVSVRQRLMDAGSARVRLFTWRNAGAQLAALYRTLADA